MQEDIEIYYDKEGNYLEIIFEKKEGFFTETENEDIMQKVDKEGNVLALSILNAVSKDNTIPLTYSFHRAKNNLSAAKTISDKNENYNKQ